MNLLDRIRGRSSASTSDAAWDDGDAVDVAATVATIAATWDASSDDPRVSASRSVVLGRYAAEMPERVSPLPGTPGRLPPTTGVVPLIRRGGRRPVLVLVAAGFLLAMSIGTVMATVPGGPLYGLRVASEAFLLPPEPEAWSTAQVERLDRRVAEAADAAERDDRGALAAALRSYARIATETAAGAQLDPATAARLMTRVQAQLELISLDRGR